MVLYRRKNLLFYAQAFQLARDSEGLFPEKFKAWADRPCGAAGLADYSTPVILPNVNRIPGGL